MPRLLQIEPLEAFRLRLRYDDGAAGVVDLSDLVGKGVFASWRAPGAFAKGRIGSSGAVEWDGEIDLCPDALYLRLTGKRPDEIMEGLRTAPARA